ncbi:hypothetical protein [Nocardioides yefusunii]|uniref:YbjN domain-containing protein n=1 Tax=Nocardioides yefusunii TaxID=2500546 RepID=A0ABW1QZ53_9ACTN|nr:hypothetical protein [Nocardioides yefusunii]
MNDDDLLALLDTTLGDVLSAAGFSPAQGGWDGVTFFCDADAFCRAFTWLPQAKPEGWMRGATIDVVLEFDQTTGLLARAYLEGKTLASTLYGLRQGGLSADLKSAFGKPLDEALPVLRDALVAVFTEPEESLTSEPFVAPA